MKQDSKPFMSNTVDKHTPGLWEIRGNHIFKFGTYEKIAIVCVRDNYEPVTFLPKSDAEAEANAALIASAPQLKKENEELRERNRALVEALQNIQQIENGAFGLKAFDVVRLKAMISEALQSNQ